MKHYLDGHRCNELYDELSPEIHEKLKALETTANFPAGTQIMRAGVYPDNLIIITSGLVEISLPVARGAFSLVLAGRGKVLGLRSLISEALPETNVTTLKTTTVAMIPERAFIRILHQYTHMYLAIAKVLSSDLHTADRLLRQVVVGPPAKSAALRVM
jgi:CRP-like cAMP-binding protein